MATEQETSIIVLKWIAGVLAGVAVSVISAGNIGGVILVRSVDRMSGNVSANTASITQLVDLKANKEDVDHRFAEARRDADANSARIVILNNRVDKVFARKDTVYHPPLSLPGPSRSSFVSTRSSCIYHSPSIYRLGLEIYS